MGKIELRNISKTYGSAQNQIVAIEDVNLDIEDGEFITLVGPSGCGKSTTLRCLAGLEDVTQGTILLNGEDITDKTPSERDIAMVFQNYALYPNMTARQNISFGLKMSTDLTTEEIDGRVTDAAEMMEITSILEKKPRALSGGQQQRVALGRAIVREPEIFLLDEPLSNLDAKLRTTMRTELQNLQDQLGVTTVYVTHDQTEAMTMGDRIAVLNDGKLQQVAEPKECYHHPKNGFVAEFIGSPSMNLFTVDVTERSLRNTSLSIPISAPVLDSIPDQMDAVLVGIRPEDIAISSENGGIRTTVDVVEPTGELTYIYIRVGDETLTCSLLDEYDIEPGDEVSVSFPDEHIHIFDLESGQAMI